MKKKGKILQIFNKYLQPGGEEKSVDRIYHNLKDHYEIKRCIQSTQIWKEKNAPLPIEQIFLLFKNRELLDQVRNLHLEFQPDTWILHNYMPVFSISLLKLADELNTPVIQFCHNYKPFSLNGAFWSKNLFCLDGLHGNYLPEISNASWQNSIIKSTILAIANTHAKKNHYYDNITSWIAISNFVKKVFIKSGIHKKKIYTLRHNWNIINEKPFYYNLKSSNSSPDHTQTKQPKNGYYITLSRFTKEKGVDFLIQTWNSLHEKLAEKCPTLIICGDGPMRKDYINLSKDNPTIILKKFITGDEKHKLLKNSKVVIIPSLWWEPLGLIAYEAYDYGKPILTANSGGLPETVIHKKTGYIHSPKNKKQLLNQILNLENNPKLLIEFGRNGRKWLEENTTIKTWINNFDSIYDKTLNNFKNKKHNQNKNNYLKLKTNTMIIIGHVPPPAHGQSLMLKKLLTSLASKGKLRPDISYFNKLSKNNNFLKYTKLQKTHIDSYKKLFKHNPHNKIITHKYHHVNSQLSINYQDIGSFRPTKLFLLLRYIIKILKKRLIYKTNTLYLIPAPPRRSALYRDWVIMLFLKPFFKKIILHWHGVGLGIWLNKDAFFLEKWITKLLFKNISDHIVLSKNLANDLKIFKPQKIHILANGIDDPIKDETKLLENRKNRLLKRQYILNKINQNCITDSFTFNILFLSQCSEGKGLFKTIEASEILAKNIQNSNINLPIKLNIAGNFTNTKEKQKFEIISSKINNKYSHNQLSIHYHKFVDGAQKHKLFKDADVFCLPTYYKYEGQPLVLLEALAYALPIITTKWRGIPEILDNKTALFMKNNSTESLVDELIKSISKDKFMEIRTYYKKHFKLKIHLKNIKKILKSILNENKDC